MNKLVQKLIEKNLIKEIIGNIPTNLQIGLAIQVRSYPKEAFHRLIILSKAISNKSLIVFADDIYSQTFLNRKRIEQVKLNRIYRKFFANQNCLIKFTSEIFKSNKNRFLKDFIDLASNITLKEFIQCLPLEKGRFFKKLDLSELLHTCFELNLLKKIAKTHNSLIIGPASRAIIILHHKTSPKGVALPAIVALKSYHTKELNYLKTLNLFRKK